MNNSFVRVVTMVAGTALPAYTGAYFIASAIHAPWIVLGTGISLVLGGVVGMISHVTRPQAREA